MRGGLKGELSKGGSETDLRSVDFIEICNENAAFVSRQMLELSETIRERRSSTPPNTDRLALYLNKDRPCKVKWAEALLERTESVKSGGLQTINRGSELTSHRLVVS